MTPKQNVARGSRLDNKDFDEFVRRDLDFIYSLADDVLNAFDLVSPD
jgi:hypothetical protein